MIVRVQVALPAWQLSVPEFAEVDKEELLKEWVWKHGKDQLLSKLKLSALINADVNTSVIHGEQKKERGEFEDPNRQQPTPRPQQPEQDQQQRLDLLEKLQTVKQDFLERVQEEDDAEVEDPEDPSHPANVGLRELLDSVLAWSGTDYGFIAPVEEHRLQKTVNMNDVSELDISDGENQKSWKIGHKLAAVNVPMYDPDAEEFEETDSDSDYYDDDESSIDSDANPTPPRRSPQPITTYGPVYYKAIRGSLTLMMDQLRFEPANPLDMLHEGEDEDASEQDDAATASHEYNYMEIYWNKVEKYQLTPKSSTRKHLFKLKFRKPGSKHAHEVVLKMKNRVELERIVDDVKARVELPSRKKSKSKPMKRRKRRRTPQKRTDSNSSPSSVLTPRERAVMLPPSLPRRMTSERSLGYNSSGHGNLSDHSPAPRRPTRRPTADPSKASITIPCSSDYEFEDADDDDDDGETELWAIQDLIDLCRHFKRPLTYRARKRDKKPSAETGYYQDDEDKEAKKIIPLLPKAWEKLVVLPLFDAKKNQLQSIMVIAATENSDTATTPTPSLTGPTVDFASKKSQEWWIPIVTTALRDLFQYKARQEVVSTSSKAVRRLQEQLKDSLRKHSDMIHGILPPMAISKLKLQPQQWKSPLKDLFQAPPKPSVVPVSAGVLSVDNSSISGSMHSRYGFLGSEPVSIDSNSTLQTNQYTAESGSGLYSVSENDAERGNVEHYLPERSSSTKTALQPQTKRPVPQRTNSVGNINVALRGLQRQGSVTSRAGTRPIFTRVDSKRGIMLMRAGSARGGGLMRMGSAKRDGLVKVDSARFSRGLARLNSLKSLGGGRSVATSGCASTVDTFDQSWRTMYTDDESIHPDDLSGDKSATQQLSVLSQDVAYLTNESSVRYINSAFIGGMKDVQALYAGRKNASIIVICVAYFSEIVGKVDVGSAMDLLAKVLFTVDRLCEKHRTIKASVIGDTIIVMSGLFTVDSDDENDKNGSENKENSDRNAAIAALEMAKDVVSEAQTIEIPHEPELSTVKKGDAETLKIRVGIHLGNVKYGVLGQNVPLLNCFGDDIACALRLQETAPDNCIRVSQRFRDIVGDAEDDWEQAEAIPMHRGHIDAGGGVAPAPILLRASPSCESTAPSRARGRSSQEYVDTYVLEPPPPAIFGGNCTSSVSSSFPSLATYGASDFLQTFDEGGLLGVQFEESFVSGEFDVD